MMKTMGRTQRNAIAVFVCAWLEASAEMVAAAEPFPRLYCDGGNGNGIGFGSVSHYRQ